jgi:hypothetical protein
LLKSIVFDRRSADGSPSQTPRERGPTPRLPLPRPFPFPVRPTARLRHGRRQGGQPQALLRSVRLSAAAVFLYPHPDQPTRLAAGHHAGQGPQTPRLPTHFPGRPRRGQPRLRPRLAPPDHRPTGRPSRAGGPRPGGRSIAWSDGGGRQCVAGSAQNGLGVVDGSDASRRQGPRPFQRPQRGARRRHPHPRRLLRIGATANCSPAGAAVCRGPRLRRLLAVSSYCGRGFVVCGPRQGRYGLPAVGGACRDGGGPDGRGDPGCRGGQAGQRTPQGRGGTAAAVGVGSDAQGSRQRRAGGAPVVHGSVGLGGGVGGFGLSVSLVGGTVLPLAQVRSGLPTLVEHVGCGSDDPGLYGLRFARIRGCFWESTRDLLIQVRWQIP